MERRDELLRAAARVYAQNGYRGSTTRRIADEANVNEITIFRHFGTKDALIHEAVACHGHTGRIAEFPMVSVDPFNELVTWVSAVREHIADTRHLLRRCISEREEHPGLISSANRGPTKAAEDLRAYLDRLVAQHNIANADTGAAAGMLIASIFADTMARDGMPDMFPYSPAHAVRSYVAILLGGLRVPFEQTAEVEAEA